MCVQSIEDLLWKLRGHAHSSKDGGRRERGHGHQRAQPKLERTSSLPPFNAKRPLSTRNSAPSVKTEHMTVSSSGEKMPTRQRNQNGLHRESTQVRLEMARARLLEEDHCRTRFSGYSDTRDCLEEARARLQDCSGSRAQHEDDRERPEKARTRREEDSDSRGCPGGGGDDYSDVNTRECLEIVRARLVEDHDLRHRHTSGVNKTSSRLKEYTTRDDILSISREALFNESLKVEVGGESGNGSLRQLRQQRREKGRCVKCEGVRGTPSGGGGRNRRGRSRSDGHREHRGSGGSNGEHVLVDTSLDDDCPGVLENRVRRPRYQHHHQHYVCKQCLSTLGGVAGTKGGGGGGGEGRRGSGGRHCSTTHDSADQHHVSVSNGAVRSRATPPLSSSATTTTTTAGQGGSGPTLVMTLDDMRTAALLLEKSAEFVENDGTDDDNTSPVPADEVRVQSRSQKQSVGGDMSPPDVPVGVVTTPRRSSPERMKKDSSGIETSHREGNRSHHHDNSSRDFPWRDFPYPPKPSRSGRDSPAATDMAVACLDLNSVEMLQPLHTHHVAAHLLDWRGGGMAAEGVGLQRHLHLHNHTHYHHIIHHHSQP